MTEQRTSEPVDGSRSRVIGAYALQPGDPADRAGFLAQVLALPGCDGLELPFGSAGYAKDAGWLWDALPLGAAHVFTLVAASMEALAGEPAWGPASTDSRGRGLAVEMWRQACDEVARVSAAGHRILAVEVQTAPRHTAIPAPNATALAQTLAEALSWDWSGAELLIEHCDAAGPHAAKGFLPLAEELAVLTDVGRDSATPSGVVLNWGRSAIEARDANGIVGHLTQAREAGLLRAIMLSGTVPVDGAFGPAWADAHAPLTGAADVGEPASLLTVDHVRRTLAASGRDLLYDGLKVSVRPRDTTDKHRLATLRALLTAMAD